jgi:HTH-type transcriptional regulator/antitoxin HipB
VTHIARLFVWQIVLVYASGRYFNERAKVAMRQLITTPGQVGEILRGRRKARGLAQDAVAVKLGVSQSRLSTLEQDAAGLTLERLLALANLLGLELVLQDRPASTTTPVRPAARGGRAKGKGPASGPAW